MKIQVVDLQTAGFHRIVWDSCDNAQRLVAVGVHFYRLEASGDPIAEQGVSLFI